jgi:DNA-binding transcriptional ArsR family regulator
MGGVSYVEAEDLAARPLRFAAAPLCSLMAATRDAAGAVRSDTPEAWCRAIRAHLTGRDYEVLAPLSVSQPAFVPDAILPAAQPPGQPLKDALEQIVAAADDLVRDIESCRSQGPTGDWRVPAGDPQRWTRGLVLALARAWSGFRPIWESAQQQLAREADRISAASERGGHLHLLATTILHSRVTGGRWEFDACNRTTDVRLAVPDEGLVLLPLVAGGRASIVDDARTTLHHVGYPLRPVASMSSRAGRPSPPLEALLGIPRARILRELDQPTTNGRLAASLRTVASTATHHVSALESAGLVIRDRSGPGLLVRRTPQGDALLALYETE